MHVWVEDIKEHTMGSALIPYIGMKIDPLIASFSGSEIIVRGAYDRKYSIISTQEKNNKLFKVLSGWRLI